MGHRTRSEQETYNPSPSHLDIKEATRFIYLWNEVLDEEVAILGRGGDAQPGQAPSMLMTLILCQGVYEGSDAFYLALSTQPWAAPFWAGKRASVRKVYTRVRAKLEGSFFELTDGGYYGFYLRASADQRARIDRAAEQRRAKAAASRARRKGVSR